VRARVTRADIEALIATSIAVAERDEPSATAGAGRGAPARRAQSDRDVGAVDFAEGPRGVGVPRRVACAERLAICAEAGDVSAARAAVLAIEDARLCAAGRLCVCEVER
jgi:hypothetical protein